MHSGLTAPFLPQSNNNGWTSTFYAHKQKNTEMKHETLNQRREEKWERRIPEAETHAEGRDARLQVKEAVMVSRF